MDYQCESDMRTLFDELELVPPPTIFCTKFPVIKNALLISHRLDEIVDRFDKDILVLVLETYWTLTYKLRKISLAFTLVSNKFKVQVATILR